MNVIREIWSGFLISILIYYLLLHLGYFILILIGMRKHLTYYQAIKFGDFRRMSESPSTLPISIIVPAYNEELLILSLTENILGLRYPEYELVIVNDGSTDRTLRILVERFGLKRFDLLRKQFESAPIRGVYRSLEFPNLVVVDKENGRRADAINAGANVARYPLLLTTDADTVLEEDALIRIARPFMMNARTIAAAGIVRPLNGVKLANGKIVAHTLPRNWLPLFQVVEYLRSFQWARLGLAGVGSMLCIAGAFTLVRRDVFVEIGGMQRDSRAEDVDLTIDLYRYLHEHKSRVRYEIVYVPDPACYTLVPDTIGEHFSQRRRWQQGTLQALINNGDMIFNPRFGLTGLFGMPFFLIFEGFSGVIEGLSWILIPGTFVLGLTSLKSLIYFFVFAVLLGTALSLAGVLFEERTRLRQTRVKDVLRLLLAGLLENVGYHQMYLLWRIVGTFDYLTNRRPVFAPRTVAK